MRMIRLLRRKRNGSGLTKESSSEKEMIEPTPPTRIAASTGEIGDSGQVNESPVFGPTLKVVHAEEREPSELEGETDEFPHFTFRSPRDEDAVAEEPIHLEVHNTAEDDEGSHGSPAGKSTKKSTGKGARSGQYGKSMPGSEDGTDDDPAKLKGALLQTVPFRETSLAKIDEEPGKNPSFNIFANPRIWRHDERNLNYSGEVAKLYRDVFTPTRPKRNYRDFSGRRETIEAIIQAVEEERSHVILLGEKSLGKTSLLNIVADCASEAGYLVARMTGTADMTFRHFIEAILEQFTARIDESPVKDILQKRLGTEDLCDLLDPDSELDVPAAIKIFQRLSEHQAVVLIDDFQRIENPELMPKMGELMAVLSDQGAWLSLMLFGRASRASEVLPKTFQTLPNVTWMKLQPMDDDEAQRVIARGVASVGVQFNDDVTEAIVRLAQGMPSAIQWLCLLAIRRATQRYASEVEMHDLAEVINMATSKIDAKLSAFYDEICGPARGNWAGDVLYLAVQTPTDKNGVFSTESMSRISYDIIGRPLLELPLHSALSRFSGEDEEPVLEKIWTATGTCYRFANPAMRSIVMLKNCGRLPNMPESLLKSAENLELLPSPGIS